jgi:hypothetical protein
MYRPTQPTGVKKSKGDSISGAVIFRPTEASRLVSTTNAAAVDIARTTADITETNAEPETSGSAGLQQQRTHEKNDSGIMTANIEGLFPRKNATRSAYLKKLL